MLRLRVRSAAATVLLAAALSTSACAGPSPAPATPSASPTPASDEEAFRAAEATYRAYVDALNAVDLADPTTFEPVFALTTEQVTAADRDNLARLHDEGVTLSGETRIIRIAQTDVIGETVLIEVCLDVSTISLVGSDGVDHVDVNRSPRQSVAARIDLSSSPGRVAELAASEGNVPC